MRWPHVGRSCHTAAEVVAVIDAWKAHFTNLRLWTGNITLFTEWIDADKLLAEYPEFDTGRYQQTSFKVRM
jgi:hypothetical protein